ncbi:MAG: hypothetical protein BWZ04_02911 [Firmicutes bacterium ADurb.BinA205]|nr:MAG: hypothetical protein BWZ04_02911 [Firmicutes bacterium ADurb.BinA205]
MRDSRIIRFDLSLYRLRLHRFRLFLFGFSPADILIHTAVQELIIGDILRHSETAAFTLNGAIVRIERECARQRNNLRNLASNLVTKSVTDFHDLVALLLSLFRFECGPLSFLFSRKVGIVPEP